MFSVKNLNSVTKIVSGAFISLPVTPNISMWWNFGSLLSLCLLVQIFTGLMLAMNFCGDVSLAFFSVSHISSDVPMGWLMRMIHANGASMFFFCLYLHIGRGMYYGSYRFSHTWNVGVLLLFAVMATAFLGYVLPWGQMSFWGATVITNLFSALPYVGEDVVIWLWGGFAVDNSTLSRFFSLHFIIPFIISALVMIHLAFLHESGSNNPLGFSAPLDKVSFSHYFIVKDLYGFFMLMTGLMVLVFLNPWLLGDCENFINANPMVTPVHIQPEWYFLFAYAILRAIPNKLGGVMALVMSIFMLFSLPFQYSSNFRGFQFYPPMQSFFWSWISCVLLLTWIGMRPVEAPYIFLGQVISIIYFSYFICFSPILVQWDSFLK